MRMQNHTQSRVFVQAILKCQVLIDCVEEVAFWTGVTLRRASGAEGVVTNQAAMIRAGAEISLPVPWF